MVIQNSQGDLKMPVFHYDALDTRGNESTGTVEALSPKEAVCKIRHQGLYPTKVRAHNAARRVAVGDAAVNRKKQRVLNGRVKTKFVTRFARQMSTLQDAGLAILRSLRILEKQQKQGVFKRVIGCVADDIENGSTLSEAMRKYPNCFNRLFVNMIAAGEAGGVLDIILIRVADFMEKSEKLKSRVKGAMVYPVIVLLAAFLIVMGLMTFVIPIFSQVLVDLGNGKGLPPLTQFLLDVSIWLKGNHGLNAAVVVMVPFVLMTAAHLICKFSVGRYAMDWLKLHVPVLRPIIYRTAVARWTRTLATLIGAGVPILEGLQITSEAADNEVYSRMLQKAERSIRQGDTFSNPIRRSAAVDDLVVNMIEVGEETGDLDKMLLKIAETFDEEVDVMVGSLMSLLEPVMIILLGFVVGTIVLAMFLPIIGILTDLIP